MDYSGLLAELGANTRLTAQERADQLRQQDRYAIAGDNDGKPIAENK